MSLADAAFWLGWACNAVGCCIAVCTIRRCQRVLRELRVSAAKLRAANTAFAIRTAQLAELEADNSYPFQTFPLRGQDD